MILMALFSLVMIIGLPYLTESSKSTIAPPPLSPQLLRPLSTQHHKIN